MDAVTTKEAFLELLATSVTETQEVRLAKMLQDIGVPEAKHAEVIFSALKMVLEHLKRPQMKSWAETDA